MISLIAPAPLRRAQASLSLHYGSAWISARARALSLLHLVTAVETAVLFFFAAVYGLLPGDLHCLGSTPDRFVFHFTDLLISPDPDIIGFALLQAAYVF